MRTVKPKEKTSSVKVSTNAYYKIREKALKENRIIRSMLDEAIEKYIKGKKGAE